MVVDLDKKPEEQGALVRKAPEGLGATLTTVLLSPTMHIGDEDRQLLVLLSAAEVSFFDLGHLERRATVVELDAATTIEPVQVVFSASNPTLYVRGTASDNLFMFRFEPHDNDPLGNDFRPTVNPLAAGSRPRDMVLFGSGVDERLLVVSDDKRVRVIDPSSSKTVALELSAPAQTIALFDATSPADSRVQTRALVYAEGQSVVTFVDPEELIDSPEDKLESFRLSGGLISVMPLPGLDKHLIFHSAGVTLLDLAERTTTVLSSAAIQPSDTIFDAERSRVWVAQRSQPFVASIDLSTGMTDELVLDGAVASVLPFLQLGWLAVSHGDYGRGYVTLVDTNQPDRAHAVSLYGFQFQGILDRGGL
ncbi:MAG: hypothetical protein ABW321_18300 [Polyangiales bacterium]